MKSMTNGNYAAHAKFWNWGGNDRTQEHEFWYKYAQKFGNNVLIPMCALGEAGAYMAQKGMYVTAFDITHEMIKEGQDLYKDVHRLQLFEGDITNFDFDISPVDFCYCTDFGHLLSIDFVKKALICINKHLRKEGCLVVETGLRLSDAASFHIPTQTWHPLLQVYPDMTVWKTGDTRYDANTGLTSISQSFYVKDKKGYVETFDHAFLLQAYYHEEWMNAFEECGFIVRAEYVDRNLESWQSGGDGHRIFEVIKLT